MRGDRLFRTSSPWAMCISLALSTACATGSKDVRHAPDPTQFDDPSRTPTRQDKVALSRRIYELGEAAWSGGAKFEAVALWRQAFLTVPDDPKHDVLRHRMVMRIGSALLELHALDGDAYHLEAGKEMMEKWIALRVDRDRSGARAEAYNLLGEFELRLEDPARARVQSSDDEHDAGELQRARMLSAYDGAQADHEKVDTHFGEELGAQGISRDIEVSRFATRDNPRVRAYLRDGRPLGPSVFDVPPDPFNPTRPLVRAGIPRIEAHRGELRRAANSEAWRVLRAVRPTLELCYASSMSRAPTEVVRMRVKLEVSPTGRVTAQRSEGDILGDAIGDDCLRRAFEGALVDNPGLRGQELAELPLTFFIQPQRSITPSGVPGGFGIHEAEVGYTADRNYQGDLDFSGR